MNLLQFNLSFPTPKIKNSIPVYCTILLCFWMIFSSFRVDDFKLTDSDDTSLAAIQDKFPKLKFQAKTSENGFELRQLNYELKPQTTQEKKMVVHVQSLHVGGTSPYKYSYTIQELDGSTIVDAKSLINPTNFNFTSDAVIEGQALLEYPNKMEIGDELASLSFDYQILANKIPFSWKGDVTSRKVKAIENILIEGESVEAYLIESTLHLSTSCRGYAVKNTTEYLQELYLPGCGAIRIDRNQTSSLSMETAEKSNDAKSIKKNFASTLLNLTTNF